jgi:uncharacterized delta-60 repeat protein
MKKIFVLILVITLIPIHCSKKKQNNLLWLLLLLNNSNSFNNSNNSNDIIGVIDTSFGNNGTGTQIIPIRGTNNNDLDKAYSIAIQNGKILLGGHCKVAGGNYDFCIARLNLDGTLDTSFGSSGLGSGGKIIYDYGFNRDDESYSIQVLSDGSILQTGTCIPDSGRNYSDFFISKLDLNGNLDTNFNSNGKKQIPIFEYDTAYTSYIKDDFIFIGGTCNDTFISEPDQFCIAKLDINNAYLDNTFDSDGKVTIDMASGQEEIWSLIVDNNNKIYAGGYCNDGDEKFCLARFNSNGSLDTSFGSSGTVIQDISSGNDEAYAMVLQSDGKILLGGFCVAGDEKFCLARFNSNGSLDTSFGSSGKVIQDISSSGNDRAYAMVLQSDGKILLGGYCNYGGKKFCLARFNSNGSLDTSFGSSGTVIQDISSGNDEAYAMVLQSDGKILLGGFCETSSGNFDFCIARFK